MAPKPVTCLSTDALVMDVLIPGSLMSDPIAFRISKLASSMVLGVHTVRSLIRLTLMAHQVTAFVTVITSFDK